MGFIEIIFVVAIIASAFSSAKKRRQHRTYKAPLKMLKPKGSTTIRSMRVLPQKDLIRSYSSKNKECYEHEVMVSSLDSQKPKRKKSLWNEPSWDDELYS